VSGRWLDNGLRRRIPPGRSGFLDGRSGFWAEEIVDYSSALHEIKQHLIVLLLED
jgi:hypothetical protein